MIVAFSVAPSGRPADAAHDPGDGDGASVHRAVAAAVAAVRESGLPHRTSSMFTEVEGEWDEVMGVVKAACDAVAPFGSRVSLVLKADIRPGRTGELDGKLERLEAALDEQVSAEAHVDGHGTPTPSIRRTTVEDLPAVLAMKNAAWRETYAQVLTPDAFDRQDALLPEAVGLWTGLLAKGGEAWLAEEPDGTVVGMAAAGPADDPRLGPDGVELTALYVLERLHGTGLGHRLLAAAVGDRPARLDVLVGNDRAVRFYERHGFTAVGEPVVLSGIWGQAREQRMVRRPRA